jgi:hypothetical protein
MGEQSPQAEATAAVTHSQQANLTLLPNGAGSLGTPASVSSATVKPSCGFNVSPVVQV